MHNFLRTSHIILVARETLGPRDLVHGIWKCSGSLVHGIWSVLDSCLFFLVTPRSMQFSLAPNVPRSTSCLRHWERPSPGLGSCQQPWAFMLPCPLLPSNSSSLCLLGAWSPPFPACGLLLLLHAPSCDKCCQFHLRCFLTPSPSLSYHCLGQAPHLFWAE